MSRTLVRHKIDTEPVDPFRKAISNVLKAGVAPELVFQLIHASMRKTYTGDGILWSEARQTVDSVARELREQNKEG